MQGGSVDFDAVLAEAMRTHTCLECGTELERWQCVKTTFCGSKCRYRFPDRRKYAENPERERARRARTKQPTATGCKRRLLPGVVGSGRWRRGRPWSVGLRWRVVSVCFVVRAGVGMRGFSVCTPASLGGGRDRGGSSPRWGSPAQRALALLAAVVDDRALRAAVVDDRHKGASRAVGTLLAATCRSSLMLRGVGFHMGEPATSPVRPCKWVDAGG
jgi:hypothetical protein